MKEGPWPYRGYERAMAVALARGWVLYNKPSSWQFCDFLIRAGGRVVAVSVRPTRNFHATISDIRKEFHPILLALRVIPGDGPVSRELWLYSRHGGFRFFRVGDFGLQESDSLGELLPEEHPAVQGALSMCGNLLPAVRAISSLSRNLLPAVPVAPSGNGETLPVKPAAIWQEEPVDPDSLAYINRWLAKKNGGYPMKSEG